jgi:hypothetical protein
MRSMGVATLWFLGIYALVMAVLYPLIVIDVFDLFGRDTASPIRLSETVASASSIYLLVTGIVMPSYLETALSFGLTRRQNACALLLVSALLAFGLTLVSELVALVFAEPANFLWSIQAFLHGWFFYLIGWLIVIGYQYRRIIGALLTTALGVGLFFSLLAFTPSWSFVLGETSVLNSISEGALVSLLFLFSPFSLLACLALALVIVLLTRRIPIKV